MRPDPEELYADLAAIDLAGWRKQLERGIGARFSDAAHGDLGRWREIVETLPIIRDAVVQADRDVVTITSDTISTADAHRIAASLKELIPWRKGPFRVFGIDIDAEWRSDLKWSRVRNAISPLAGRNVLDVGCGNGYYAMRMHGAGAARVIGIDPGLLQVCQFLALKKLAGIERVHVLPLRLEDLPDGSGAFDTTFSMGVLYHRRDPLQHLQALKNSLRPGGELVLETLVLPGNGEEVLEPGARYARMRNVWHLPTVTTLLDWLASTGFVDLRLVHTGRTSTAEQRSTEWMPFESLREALSAEDAGITIEGLPAPTRAVLLGRSI